MAATATQNPHHVSKRKVYGFGFTAIKHVCSSCERDLVVDMVESRYYPGGASLCRECLIKYAPDAMTVVEQSAWEKVRVAKGGYLLARDLAPAERRALDALATRRLATRGLSRAGIYYRPLSFGDAYNAMDEVGPNW